MWCEIPGVALILIKFGPENSFKTKQSSFRWSLRKTMLVRALYNIFWQDKAFLQINLLVRVFFFVNSVDYCSQNGERKGLNKGLLRSQVSEPQVSEPFSFDIGGGGGGGV